MPTLTIQQANRIVALRKQGYKLDSIAKRLGVDERLVREICRPPAKPPAKTNREKRDAQERKDAIAILKAEGHPQSVIDAVFGKDPS